MAAGRRNTYWKSSTTKVIGHRGMGSNTASQISQLCENTIMSFITAASSGAEYVEFDVQITKDLVPVLYHDWTFSESGYDIPIHEVTLQQFLSLKTNGDNNNNNNNKPSAQDRKVIEELTHLSLDANNNSDSSNKKIDKNTGSIQTQFATLAETFKEVPLDVGFNIEVKYPMLDESQLAKLPPFHVELNSFIDTILHCVYQNTQEDRRIIFSSFHPSVCLMLALKQPNYPVFFLSDAGYTKMADPRCNSIQEAIKFAKFSNLTGIVTLVKPILEAPRLVRTIKEAGLLLFTYGKLNNNIENAKLQRKAGVDAVIVDSVLEIVKGLRDI